jgi:hypothetical protein
MEITTSIKELANEFSNVINRWLSTKELKEIRKRNKTQEYDGVCASHDFCDANMAMYEAWCGVIGREPNFAADADIKLWNAAWDIAKKSGFARNATATAK